MRYLLGARVRPEATGDLLRALEDGVLVMAFPTATSAR
jgi:hypothetical protein